MASGGILAITGLFVYVFTQQFSPAAGEYCSGMSQTLDEGCTISSDCSTVTCKINFVQKPITFKLKVNKCDKPVTVRASMDVPDLFVTWSHTYTSNDIVEVPGFTVSVPGVPVSVGVYVQVELKDNGDRLQLKVKLLAGGKILGKEAYPVKVTVIKGDLPISTDDCGMFKWWYDMSDPLKAAVIGGPLLVIFILVIYCCCCRSRPRNQGAVILAPAAAPTAVIATSTNSNAPVRPLAKVA